jgi:hypothetical protein
MRDRRSDERDVEQALDIEIVEVSGLAAQDPGILRAPDGVAEDRSGGDHG